MASDKIKSLGQELPAGHVDSLQHLTSEQAAVALVNLFLRTGAAQATVEDTDEVRRLVRRDCRRRGIKVKTFAAHGVVVVHDEERYDAFLATDEGREYRQAMTARMLSAFDDLVPPTKPTLRPVPPPE